MPFLLTVLTIAFMEISLMVTRKIASLIGVFILLCVLWGREVIAQDRCLEADGSYNQQKGTCDHNIDDFSYKKFDGIVYRGVINAKPITLEIIGQGDGYRMSVDGQVTLGELNTERGFNHDENASLFILNWQQPESEQIKFVRLSKNYSVLFGVNANGELDNTATLHALETVFNHTSG